MQTLPAEVAASVFSAVLSDFAFIFVNPVSQTELKDPTGRMFAVNLSFEGPLRGNVAIAVSEEVVREMASNILGIATGVPEAEVCGQDALKELVSIVGGRVVTALAGPEAVFKLDTPRLDLLVPEAWAWFQGEGASLCFESEGRPLMFRLYLDAGEPRR